ncbi:hypothetical protein H5410_042119 [Solanum commersonii]|uniref:Uncharacterized protein n=1 Tax=Solanum commersonii TaxID=4109 RepID=A0A9J5XUU0_SOLCO|nr:hypothetical protein H5410_042119 [Solanum commersonii]
MTPSPGVRQSMPMPPLFPNLDEHNRVNYFTISQSVQNAPPIHQVTQNAPHIFTVALSKAQYISVAHDATNPQQVPPVYTYVVAPPMTQIHELCRPDVDHYVEAEKEARLVSDELINKKLKNLEDAMRSLRELGSNQSEPLSVVFERLQASGLLYLVEGRIPDRLPRSFDPSKTCAYHSGVKGHSTNCCYALKHRVEDFIEMKQITVRQSTPNVNNNPLPNHNSASVNMIGVGDGDDDPTNFIVHVESI